MKCTTMQLLLLPLFVSLVPATAFTSGSRCPKRCSTRHSAAALSECFAANEFSRLLDPERVLKGGRQKREYSMSIKATEEECQGLAKRFDLGALGPLEAEAILRPASITEGVEVEGTIRATLTQRCVRTNEDFSVNVEFPLYAIVRPVMALNIGGGTTESDPDLNDDQNKSQRSKKPPSLENLDVFQLQRLLQDDDDDELADVLMEDQAIFPIGGQMDLGELVAQLFWLHLDPYPKKPGSEPIQRSISG